MFDNSFEQYALIIWNAPNSDGGKLRVYGSWHDLFASLTVGDLSVEQTYAGRLSGLNTLIVDAYRDMQHDDDDDGYLRDRDGVAIKSGDKVWNVRDDEPCEWTVIESNNGRDDLQKVTVTDGQVKGVANPENLTHTRPDFPDAEDAAAPTLSEPFSQSGSFGDKNGVDTAAFISLEWGA